MKKILITSLISLMLVSSASADTDGENSLSKKNTGQVNTLKKCHTARALHLFFKGAS